MDRLDMLLRAYIDLSIQWGKMSDSEARSRMWQSCGYLQSLISRELKREGRTAEALSRPVKQSTNHAAVGEDRNCDLQITNNTWWVNPDVKKGDTNV